MTCMHTNQEFLLVQRDHFGSLENGFIYSQLKITFYLATVGVVSLAGIKFGNLTANTYWQTSNLADRPRYAKILSECSLKNRIGGDFSLAIEEKFAKPPN